MAIVAQTDTAREALRARQVGEFITTPYQLAQTAASTRLTEQQANRLERLADFDVPLAVAELESRRSGTANVRQRTSEAQQLAGLNLENLRAEIEDRRRSGLIKDIQARRLTESAGVDLDRAKAELQQITQQNQERAETAEFRRRLADIESRQYRYRDSAGREVVISGKQITDLLLGEARIQANTDNQAAVRNEAQQRLQQTENRDAGDRLKAATDAENILITPPKGQTAASVAPATEIFNANSEQPFVYITTGEGRRTVNGKYQLPRTASGRSLTARQVYSLARENGITVKDYLERVLYPSLGGTAPWLQQPRR